MTEEQWLADSWDVEDFLHVLEDEEGKASARKLRLFAIACCRSVWHLLNGELTPQAVEAVERLLEGRTAVETLDRIRKVAEEANRNPILAGREATLASGRAGLTATITQELFEYCSQARDASDMVIALVAHSAITASDWGSVAGDVTAERVIDEQIPRHCHFIRDVFGNPFRPIHFDPAWQTPTVLSLAQAAYDVRTLPGGELETVRLAVLADALEEAGCTNEDIFSHLRSAGPHVRGCWVVDLLLGKE